MGPERITVRYDWITAYKCGITDHPQIDIKNLGCKVFAYEAVGMGDCSFMEIDKLPEPCPDYIKLSNFKIE